MVRGRPFLIIPVRLKLFAPSSFPRVAENFAGRVDSLALFLGNCLVYGKLDDLLVRRPAEFRLESLGVRVWDHSEAVVVEPELNESCWARGNGPDRSR